MCTSGHDYYVNVEVFEYERFIATVAVLWNNPMLHVMYFTGQELH